MVTSWDLVKQKWKRSTQKKKKKKKNEESV